MMKSKTKNHLQRRCLLPRRHQYQTASPANSHHSTIRHYSDYSKIRTRNLHLNIQTASSLSSATFSTSWVTPREPFPVLQHQTCHYRRTAHCQISKKESKRNTRATHRYLTREHRPALHQIQQAERPHGGQVMAQNQQHYKNSSSSLQPTRYLNPLKNDSNK